jgi:hypothetical protein
MSLAIGNWFISKIDDLKLWALMTIRPELRPNLGEIRAKISGAICVVKN